MTFKPVGNILNVLASQMMPPEQKLLEELRAGWPAIVGAAVAQQSQLVSLQRGVLSVATSSAALAQDLTFKRRRILGKLNDRLGSSLNDIRFSTANWQIRNNHELNDPDRQIIWHQHPCRINTRSMPVQVEGTSSKDPHQTFQAWAMNIQARSQSWPLCPACQCPTPAGELQRWSICSICVAKTW